LRVICAILIKQERAHVVMCDPTKTI